MTRYPSSPKDEVSRARLMKKYHLALLGALCLQLTGCISYSHQQQADASAWPIPLNSAKPTVSLKVDTDYQFNGTPSQRGFNLPRLEGETADQRVPEQSSVRASRARTQYCGRLRQGEG